MDLGNTKHYKYEYYYCVINLVEFHGKSGSSKKFGEDINLHKNINKYQNQE